jgi:hypothetical protein
MFIGPQDSPLCSQYPTKFFNFSQDIGIPIKHSKTVLPTTQPIIHGILIDTQEMSMSLPPDKCSVMIHKLQSLHKRKKCTLQSLQSLIGLLNFACLVIIPGRPFLRRLIDLTKGVLNQHHHTKITKEARAYMDAWLHFLHHFNGKCLFLPERWTSSDKISLYTDSAASHGYAGVFGARWFNGSWPSTWRSYHISVLEIYPIVAALETWGPLLQNHCLLFFCDNEAVVHVINKQSAKDPTLMILVRRLIMCAMKYNILFKAKHIPGKHNTVADKLSRLQVDEAVQVAPWLAADPILLTPCILPSSSGL